MTHYIKGEDGKFAGSIGDGKTRTPLNAPTAPVARSLDEIGEEFRGVEAAYARYEQHQFDLAREALTTIIKERYPTAATLRVVDHSDEPGSPFLVPDSIRDAEGGVLWDEGDLPWTERDAFIEKLEDWSPVLDRCLASDAIDRDGEGWLLTLN